MKEKLLKIIGHYGFDNQIKKLNEEVFELTEALFLDLRVAEELADVLVILEQIKLCYEITDEEVQKIMEEKVDRQLSRIREEPKEELEEIELIDIHYVNDKCIFKVYGQSIEETIAIKVNELIDEVNKLKKERIRNNE